MYIDAIDELLDMTIDRIYEYIEKDGILKAKKVTPQTIKTLVSKLMDKFNKNDIDKLGLSQVYDHLRLMFKKYIYLYIIASVNKKFTSEEFVNFIISFKLLDSDIFDSDFNSKILFVNNIISQLEYINNNFDLIQSKSIKIDRTKFF